jgi:hypothetical protein
VHHEGIWNAKIWTVSNVWNTRSPIDCFDTFSSCLQVILCRWVVSGST